MNLNWMQRKITIIGIYAPSEDEEVNTKGQFFIKLNGMIVDIGNTRKLFLLDDFNRFINFLLVEQKEREDFNNKIWKGTNERQRYSIK